VDRRRPTNFLICSYCNRTLTRLTDRSGKNESWYCNNCSIEFNPEDEQIRHKQRLSVPNRNTETLAATTPGIDYLNANVQIHKEPEIRGGLKVLKDKGLRITSYQDSTQK
jgi:hypothetical protein